jgi:hypothetical protein
MYARENTLVGVNRLPCHAQVSAFALERQRRIGTHTPFNLPAWKVFHVHVLSFTHSATLCQKMSSGRVGGSLRTTVLRRTALFWPGPLTAFFGFLALVLLSAAVAIGSWSGEG